MKVNLFAFTCAALLASIWPDLVLLLSPLVLLIAFLRAPRRSVWALFAVAGVIWVVSHLYSMQQQQLPTSQGVQQWMLTGNVGVVSTEPYRQVFDFYPQGPFQKLKVSCFDCDTYFQRGESWQLALKLKPIHSFRNPNGFDYQNWMLSKRYVASASVKKNHVFNRRISEADPVAAKFEKSLPLGQVPILRALLLGDKQSLKAEYKRFIYTSGLGHLFVVSGLHIGMLALFSAWLLVQIQRPLLLFGWDKARHVSLVLGLGMAFLYAYLSGFNVPAVRALIMLLMFCWLIFQDKNIERRLFVLWALLMVLLVNPLTFLDMGAWLSFFIVAALVVGFGYFKRHNIVYGLLRTQLLAFITGSLVLVAFSQGIAPVGFILNLVFIPLVSLIVLPIAIMALLCSLIGEPGFLIALEQLIAQSLDALIELSPYLTWQLPIHQENRLVVYLALLMLLLPRALGLQKPALLLCVYGLFIPMPRPDIGSFKLTVLDVGQGSAAHIQTHNKDILVDTGSQFKNGMGLADFVVLPYLRQQGVNRLDLLHLSHDDNDHAGGRERLLPLSSQVVEQSLCIREDWQWDGVLFTRFQAKGFSVGNNGSCLLKVALPAGPSVLMSGDIEASAERALMAVNSKLLAADVLIVPHHGSQTSSSNGFIGAVNPKAAIISAGQLNQYGHPHGAVLQRYSQRSITIYSTATHGALQVQFEPRQEAHIVPTYRPKIEMF